jgi:mannose-6-phosphate isomerase-like protein (cupin superfamily)
MMEMTERGVLYVPAGEAAGAGKSIRLMGNRLEIKAASEHTGGAFAVLEYRMAAHTPGPPPHLHRRTDEAFHVLEGELTFHLEDRSMEAGPGDFVLVPRGVVHTFENAGSSEARFLEVAAPGPSSATSRSCSPRCPPAAGPRTRRRSRPCTRSTTSSRPTPARLRTA